MFDEYDDMEPLEATDEEVVEALENLVAKRREYMAAIVAHEREIDLFAADVAKIDLMIDSLRNEKAVSGLFEAVDVAARAMGEWL